MIDFHIDWKNAPGVRDPVLARTWCALTIRVRGEPVTRVYDRRTKGWRDSVYGSVFHPCRWLVDNLWFLLYEPYRWAIPYGARDLARNDADRPWVHRHSLLAAREGGALPDLTIFRDGDSVLARWLKDGGDASHPFLRFVQEGQAHLNPDTVRADISAFVETVLERVSDLPHAEVAQLRDDWKSFHRLTAEEKDLCSWSARLGVNAHYDDQLSDSEAERLASAIEGLEGRIADDLLDATAIDTIAHDLDWIDEAHLQAGTASRTSLDSNSVRRSWRDSLGRNGTAYATGYRGAHALRQDMGVGNNAVPDLADFMHRLGWADRPIIMTQTAPSNSLHAIVDYGRDDVPVVAAHTTYRTDERAVPAREIPFPPSQRRRTRAALGHCLPHLGPACFAGVRGGTASSCGRASGTYPRRGGLRPGSGPVRRRVPRGTCAGGAPD